MQQEERQVHKISAADLPSVQGQVEVPFEDSDLPLYADTGELDHATLAFAVAVEEKLAVLARRLEGDPEYRTESMGTNLCLRACMIESLMIAKPFCRKMLNLGKKQTPLRFRKLRRACVEWLRLDMPVSLQLTEIPEGYLEDDFLKRDPETLSFLQSLNDLTVLAEDSLGPNFKHAMIRTAARKYNYELAAKQMMRDESNPMETQEIAHA